MLEMFITAFLAPLLVNLITELVKLWLDKKDK